MPVYQTLFSEVILQTYIASFFLKHSQTFCKLWVEMFPSEMGENSKKGQWTLPVLQRWWKLFEFRIVTTYIPPTYLFGNFPGFKLNIWQWNSELPYNKIYCIKFLYKNGEKESFNKYLFTLSQKENNLFKNDY